MPTYFVPVPRGKAPRTVRPLARRPGPLARLWARLARRPAVPAYATARACLDAHPGCDVWRVEV